MNTDQLAPHQGHWSPPIPEEGRELLARAREMADRYHRWIDEPVAIVQSARHAGWKLREIGDVLGCTSEFVRQLCARTSDAELPDFPDRPAKPPAPLPAYVLRRSLVSDEEIQQLIELQRIAKRRRRDQNAVCVAAADELWSRINDLVELGVPRTWLSKRMGLSANAVTWGLARYGYRSFPPSQKQTLTGIGGNNS